METNIGKKVIIRGDRSGVEFGTLVAHNGRESPCITPDASGSGLEQLHSHSSPKKEHQNRKNVSSLSQ